MIVGEPSLMGGEMDDEDERYITRIENAQYDPNVVSSSHPNPYLSPMPPGFHPGQQQNPNLQSILHHKQQQFMSTPPLIHPNQMKREQMPYAGSPQAQQLPSMFSSSAAVGPPTPSNAFPPPSTPINGEVSAGSKRISSSSSPPTPSGTHTQVSSSDSLNVLEGFSSRILRPRPRPSTLRARRVNPRGMARRASERRNKNLTRPRRHLSSKRSPPLPDLIFDAFSLLCTKARFSPVSA